MTAIAASLVSPTSPSFEAMLADRFRENPYDLAGFADLPEDDGSLKFALYDVLDCLWSERSPSDGILAKVMFVLLRVARDDYRDGIFWPHLTDHLRLGLLSGPDQAWLGDWFRRGLRRFGYFVPDAREGQTNLTPILVHAGVPRGSLESLVGFIALQLQLRGDWLANAGELDADLISQFVGEHDALPLHRNVRRALESNSRGADAWRGQARGRRRHPAPDPRALRGFLRRQGRHRDVGARPPTRDRSSDLGSARSGDGAHGHSALAGTAPRPRGMVGRLGRPAPGRSLRRRPGPTARRIRLGVQPPPRGESGSARPSGRPARRAAGPAHRPRRPALGRARL